MGVFDFVCANSNCKEWVGGQDNHDSTTVYIEVPLKNGKTTILQGEYNQYGGVEILHNGVVITFYDEQFRENYNYWDDCNTSFLSNKIWCEDCFDKYSNKVSSLGRDVSASDLIKVRQDDEEILRIDNQLVESEKEIVSLKKRILQIRKQIKELNKKRNSLKEANP